MKNPGGGEDTSELGEDSDFFGDLEVIEEGAPVERATTIKEEDKSKL